MPRHPKHDYRSPSTYHITLRKLESVPDFSVVTGRPESWYLLYSPIGNSIEKSIKNMPKENPNIRVYRYCIMPDHVHLLLRVTAYIDLPIGIYIGKLKVNALHLAIGRGFKHDSLFERDFHDRIVYAHHSLDVIYKYVISNPYRLLVRKYYPDYFKRVNNVFHYKGIQWQAFGNMQLLQNPFKRSVICHRADERIPEKAKANRENWYHIAENGGVLVSAFIAKGEKEVRREVEMKDGKIILLVNEPFGQIYKPWGHDFQQCEKGQLLILAPDRRLPECRDTWTSLNKLADWISGWY